MDKTLEIPLNEMKIAVKNLGFSTENYEDPTLKRFLIARSMDANNAANMFVEWLKWRSAMVPLGFIPDSEVKQELETKKIFLQGLSAISANPVLIVKANRHFPSKDQPQFKKFVIHLLDKVIASGVRGKEICDEKLVAVLDLQKITYKNVDVRGFITGFQFLQAYYPERLAKLFILNMPWFFVSVWRVISRFVEKATLEKIVIVSKEEERREFMRVIGENVLPEEYGGVAKLIAIQDVVLDHQFSLNQVNPNAISNV